MNTKLKWSVAVVLLMIFSAIIIARFAHNRDLPEKLHGVWETAEEKYMDRYFLLDKNAIGFGTGDGKIDWYQITRVDEAAERNNTLYTIEFQKGEGTIFKRFLYYCSENGGKIRFKNQANVEWVLVKS